MKIKNVKIPKMSPPMIVQRIMLLITIGSIQGKILRQTVFISGSGSVSSGPLIMKKAREAAIEREMTLIGRETTTFFLLPEF